MILKMVDKVFLAKIPKKCGIASYHQGAVHPVTGKKPPTLDEFDPLNPGEWQLGVGGKILPRLPEGTRCGKLVMGKYGLYDPRIRKRQIEFFEGTHGCTMPSEEATKKNVMLRDICAVIAIFSLILTAHNFWMCAVPAEKPIWPYSLWMKKGQAEN